MSSQRYSASLWIPVGTDSYSVLEQGKIDQILSARPEDRRAVFEEASGITKYKSDKKEALQLEHTEATLRLDDVIREVKRQIISSAPSWKNPTLSRIIN